MIVVSILDDPGQLLVGAAEVKGQAGGRPLALFTVAVVGQGALAFRWGKKCLVRDMQ